MNGQNSGGRPLLFSGKLFIIKIPKLKGIPVFNYEANFSQLGILQHLL